MDTSPSYRGSGSLTVVSYSKDGAGVGAGIDVGVGLTQASSKMMKCGLSQISKKAV